MTRRVVQWLALSAGLLCPSCSLIVNASPDQCHVDADCAGRGANFTCTAQHVCASVACTSHAQCATRNNGELSVCRADGECSPPIFDGKDCKKPTSGPLLGGAGDLSDPNTILLASMLPLTGSDAASGAAAQTAIGQAFKEITGAVAKATLPAVRNGAPRPVALLQCDETDPVGTAQHLANDLQVPGIIGPFSSDALIKAAAVTINSPAKTMILSPGATAESIANLDPKTHLVWRTAPSDFYQSHAMSALIRRVEAEYRTDAELGPPSPTPDSTWIKVAMLVRGDAYGTQLADSTNRAQIIFNGKNATDNGLAYFQQINYGDPSTDPNINYTDIVNKLLAFQPGIVLVIGGGEAVTSIMDPFEAQWPGKYPTLPLPWYVMAHETRVPSLLDLAKKYPSLLTPSDRIRGTEGGTPHKDAKGVDLTGAFYLSLGNTQRLFGMTQAYDATYLMTYALLAGEAAQPPLTGGLALVAGMQSLSTPGNSVDVGPQQLLSAWNQLATGAKIDVDGASGALDFDSTKGEAPADTTIWCISRQGPTFSTTDHIYSADKGALVSTGSGNVDGDSVYPACQ